MVKPFKRRCIVTFFAGTVLIYTTINIYITICNRRRLKPPTFMQKYLGQKPKIHFEDGYTSATLGSRFQACIHPNLSLWNKEFENYFEKVEPIKCSDEMDWVYTGNGRFYISQSAVNKYGKIKCAYVPVVNSNDKSKDLKPIIPMLNGSALVSDAFKVSCKSAKGHKYANVHACIAPTTNRVPFENASATDRYNVLVFGFDSISRQTFMRLLPKTHKYFTEVLGGSLLEGYNIVGDGTTQALMPILTGNRETEIPEVRRGKRGAKYVDQILEFIWKRYERKNYVTQWGEDLANIGTFNYRLLGFKDQPVNHYMRPFYLAAMPIYGHFNRYCLGSRTRHTVYIDWLKEGLESNKGRNFFTFGFFSEYSHSNNNPIVLADDDNVAFFEYLRNNKYLDKTFLIVMSDHGARFGSIRMTEQGKLEERMPYFGVYLPPKFKTTYPEKYENLLTNTKRLVIPSDIHETFLDIIGETSSSTGKSRKVYSLFSSIPEDRTCKDAEIEPHWCACLKLEATSLSDPDIIISVQKIISHINDLLRNFMTLCHQLSLSKIIKSFSFKTNDQILKFKQSLDKDGRIPDLSDKLFNALVHYQITFETVPGNAIFEGTVLMNRKSGEIEASEKDISRLNRYYDDAKCIERSQPSLRPYCFCK